MKNYAYQEGYDQGYRKGYADGMEYLQKMMTQSILNIATVTNAKEAEEYEIGEDILKGFEKFDVMDVSTLKKKGG